MTSPQELWFELIRRASFNMFDGERVVRDLQNAADLWRGVVMWSGGSMIALRDLEEGQWNADTLMITSSGRDDAALEALAHTWGADNVWWLDGEEASRLLGVYGPQTRILCAWWD